MTEKRDPSFKLDMPFSEALSRFAATSPEEMRSSPQPAPPKPKQNKGLSLKKQSQPAAPKQRVLDLGIEMQKSVNGIEMGVLENGIPYLTQTGLSSVTGVARSVIFDISQDWERFFDDPVIQKETRIGWLKDRLFSQGYREPRLFIETKKDNSVNNAYPDVVCMALIEYYAFEAKSKNETALKAFRDLAALGLQRFIYDALGYRPSDKWKYHHDRVSILKSSAPDGHWIVFNEITGLVVDLITADLTVNSKTIPDISVGQCWGQHWDDKELDLLYGDRIKFMHNYPSYYPQAASNPQTPWAYPDASLPEFRRWFRHEYLVTKFPRYILTKANLLPGGRDEAMSISSMYRPPQINGPNEP